jgi:glutathione S-transferase
VKPTLYTFRRCPYAIRARLAIHVSGVEVEHCEVSLRNKPQALLACSPKGTVPVLQFADGSVLEESLDIMRWALLQHDPQDWLRDGATETQTLIVENDGAFKSSLDRYKYADRYPEYPAAYYRSQTESFLTQLNARLTHQLHLLDDRVSLIDMAILPFIRQFAHVDRVWFYAAPYPHLIRWLSELLNSAPFTAVMQK